MIDLNAGRYTISARFGAAFEAEKVGGDMLGLGISLTRANLSVSVRTLDYASYPPPDGFRWDFVTQNNLTVTQNGVPVVDLVRAE